MDEKIEKKVDIPCAPRMFGKVICDVLSTCISLCKYQVRISLVRKIVFN